MRLSMQRNEMVTATVSFSFVLSSVRRPRAMSEKSANIIWSNRTDGTVRIWHTDCLLRRK